MLRILLILTIACSAVAFTADDAQAFPQFQKEFWNKYLADASDDYTKLVKREAKCNLCHQGKSKKNRNAYGEALSELIGKKDKKDVEKIVAALDSVESQHYIPGDDSSATFGERIAEEQLPAGELEDLKEEPEGEDEE